MDARKTLQNLHIIRLIRSYWNFLIASTNSYPEDKDELMSLLPTKCKYCGNELPEQRAMWGKRFCNSTCAKKYSVQCSQRMKKALHRRTSQHSGPGRGKRNKTSDGLPDETDGVTPVKRGRGRVRIVFPKIVSLRACPYYDLYSIFVILLFQVLINYRYKMNFNSSFLL